MNSFCICPIAQNKYIAKEYCQFTALKQAETIIIFNLLPPTVHPNIRYFSNYDLLLKSSYFLAFTEFGGES